MGVALLGVSFVISALLPKAAVVADFAAVLLLLVQPLWGMRQFSSSGGASEREP